MQVNRDRTTLLDLAIVLSDVMDMISPLVHNHQKRAAYIAMRLGEEYGLKADQVTELVLAGLLHDIGAFSLRDRLDTLDFEFDDPHRHARLGYQLIKGFSGLSRVALIILYHHLPWQTQGYEEPDGRQVLIQSHILHLADRVSILMDEEKDILDQVIPIVDVVMSRMGTTFMPSLSKPLMSLALRESFWLNAASPFLEARLRERLDGHLPVLQPEDLSDLSTLLSRIIDYRSHYTATHSCGVAATAEALARTMDLPEETCRLMRIAGHLHDMGKLAVPSEIIEKPARLSAEEYGIVMDHPRRAARILNALPDLGEASQWVAQHHERLDGSGYPNHSGGMDISLGSRILAVADVFTAVTEDRPYRKAMTRDMPLRFLMDLADSQQLDPEVMSVMESRFDDLNDLRRNIQEAACTRYDEMIRPFAEPRSESEQ
ncbi:MAG: HD domain-containing protein [bacterium]|nr:MAG: HD domain-containing protein [bacterium]